MPLFGFHNGETLRSSAGGGGGGTGNVVSSILLFLDFSEWCGRHRVCSAPLSCAGRRVYDPRCIEREA